MSSPTPTEPPEIRAKLSRWLQRDVTGLERVGGGFNSQVYKVTAGAERFALKAYFQQAGSQRDRLACEFGSFSYLWANGMREIPQPLLSDPAQGWAIYQFVEGEKIPRGQASDAEVKAATDFLGRLRQFSRQPDSRQLGLAAEAFFAVSQIVENVRARLVRLEAVSEQSDQHTAMRRFLEKDFKPFLEEVVRWSEAQLMAAGMSFTRELDQNRRTLSPSDFGFHNALRQPDGRIIFLDFEYFGWDDSAKMIVDFLLHPAMEFSTDSKRKFTTTVLHHFDDWPELIRRVESVYPLFGLKWCMIILNEFLPDQLKRRQFAAAAVTDRSVLQAQQLEKARHMLARIRGEYQNFPYHD